MFVAYVFLIIFVVYDVAGQKPTVVLHGGSYQSITSNCFMSNRFTAACSCPPSFDAFCFDAVVYNGTTVDVTNTVFNSGNTYLNSKFCLCGRKGGFTTSAVFGGAYQQDDIDSACRYPNLYTSSCSCPAGFQSNSLRSLVFKLGTSNALIGSHIVLCDRLSSSKPVGSLTTDNATFLLNSQPVNVTVLNNFQGMYAISANQSSLKCLSPNDIPVLRPSRYLTSINAQGCNCPVNSCGASFFWVTDQLGYPFLYQRVVVCESSMQLPVSASSVKNKVMLGYPKGQHIPSDGFDLGSFQWTRDNTFTPASSNFAANANFDLWPDTTEYPSNTLVTTSLTRPDGSNTTLYGAYFNASVELQVQWLQYYGLDGVWLQPFLANLADNRVARAENFSADQVKTMAEKYNRVFGIMWDISGTTSANLYSILQGDIARLSNRGIFTSPAYIQQNGKPLVTLWGVGFAQRNVNITVAIQCIQLLKNSGFVVMGGVPFEWRTSQDFLAAYNMFDIIKPWTVGVYLSPQNFLSFVPDVQNNDVSYCAQRNMSYTPVVYAGFSWTNLQNHSTNSPLNQIPRLGGLFWQTQVDSLESSVMQQSSFSHLYLAMYEDFNEADGIAKAAESYLDKPSTGTFLSLDQDGFRVPNDHYLCLASRERYRRQQPLQINFPYTFHG